MWEVLSFMEAMVVSVFGMVRFSVGEVLGRCSVGMEAALGDGLEIYGLQRGRLQSRGADINFPHKSH